MCSGGGGGGGGGDCNKMFRVMFCIRFYNVLVFVLVFPKIDSQNRHFCVLYAKSVPVHLHIFCIFTANDFVIF